MVEKIRSIDQRIKENIKNYKLENLLLREYVKSKFESLTVLTGAKFYITDRHGEKFLSVGGYEDFTPDVVNEPGIKIRVVNRTIGHVYVDYTEVPEEKLEMAKKEISQDVFFIGAFAEEHYLHKEYAFYADELEEKVLSETYRARKVEKEDLLTGVYNQVYFTNRMRVIDRSEVAPVALIHGNINDCKFVHTHYGEEEGDRLITIISTILKEEAKPEYTIGRSAGDEFDILIPMPTDGEAEAYCQRVQERCLAYEDAVLAPSIAFGVVYKQNVEESLSVLISDAEYAMLENKLEMKIAPGYEERLKKGLK